MIFNTRITSRNIKRKFNFETKTKKAEKFREKFSELLNILDSIHALQIKRDYRFGFNRFGSNNRENEEELYEKINNLQRKVQIHVNYLCLMIEDESLELEFIRRVDSIANDYPETLYTASTYTGNGDEYIEFKKYGKYIIKNLEYKAKN